MITDEIGIQELWNKFVPIRQSYDLLDEDQKKQKSEITEKYIEMRNEIIVYYNCHSRVIEKIANKLHQKIQDVNIDDMKSWGIDGLFDAIERYDPSMGNKFETFATLRIRGSILDNIRDNDWVPRLARQRNNKIAKVKNDLECILGRVPNNQEIADSLNISLEELENLMDKSAIIGQLSISGSKEEEDDKYNVTYIPSKKDEPDSNLLKEEMFKKLLGSNFTRTERKIIHNYYYENKNIKEISEMLKISESRISQMHQDILVRIKKKIELNPEYSKDIMNLLKK